MVKEVLFRTVENQSNLLGFGKTVKTQEGLEHLWQWPAT